MISKLSRRGEPALYKESRRQLWQRIWNYRWLYVFLIPAIVWYILFAYLPIYGVTIAFKDYNIVKGVWGSEWCGLQNFIKIFDDPNFFRAFRNTIFISLLKLIFVMPCGLVLALLISEVRLKRLGGAAQSISMLPHFFSWVVIASIMTVMLSPNSGIVNKVIMMLGGEPIYFLANETWFMIWLVLSDMWESAGWNALIFIAAIGGISPNLYEAAEIDGAGRWTRLFRITLPCLKGTICTVLILKIGTLLSGNFNQVFNLYNAAVMDVADILDTYVYRLGINSMDYSYSAAIGLFQNLISLMLVLLSNKIVKKLGEDGVL